MTVRGFGRETYRRSLVVITSFLLICGGAPGLFAQSPSAAISGVILDPTGRPAFGFKVILRDVGSNTKYTSGPTDAAGNYAVQVPVGGRYKIEGVIADDGITNLPVQEVPPVSVLTAGTTRLNVRFTTGTASKTQTARGTPAEEREKKMLTKARAPWYKRPGPIVGMVLGGAAVLALALGGGGGGGGNVASQSTPHQ
jgi:hypothetical protein